MSKMKDAAIEKQNDLKTVENVKTKKAVVIIPEKESARTVRNLKQVEGLRGVVKIMKESGEVVSGVVTLKDGRVIGEGENQIGTLELLDPYTEVLNLIPLSHVVKKEYETLKVLYSGNYFYMEIVYVGKVTHTKIGSKSYHNFNIKHGEALQSDLDALRDFEISCG